MKIKIMTATGLLLMTMPYNGFSKNVEQVSKSPINIEADELYYAHDNGEVSAKGNVIINESDKTIQAQTLVGNTKFQKYQAIGDTVFKTKNANFTSGSMVYDGLKKEASLTDGRGLYNDLYYIKAQSIYYNYANDKTYGVMDKAMLTTKNAMAYKHSPDYRIDGDKIEIIDNRKVVINEARFYIKNWHFLTMKKYVSYIGRKGNVGPMSFVPIPDYTRDQGVGLKGGFALPVGDDGNAIFKYGWYSRIGFTPNFGYEHNFPWGQASLLWSKDKSYINDHNVWIKKEPELLIELTPQQLGKSKFSLSAAFAWGKWKEDGISGSHNMQNIILRHEPIVIGEKLKLKPSMGYQRDYYGYDRTKRTMFFYQLSSNFKVSRKLELFGAYTQYDYKGKTPYQYDTIDYNKKLKYGFNYEFDRLNSMEMSFEYDMDNNKLIHHDISYIRDLHSLTAKLTYRRIDHGWRLEIKAKDF